MALDMKVMVTYNVETDLDLANGGEIVVNENESNYTAAQPIIRLEYPHAYVLIRMLATKITALEGLEENTIL